MPGALSSTQFTTWRHAITARLSLLVLFAIFHLGCSSPPAPTPRGDLEFLWPQKIVSLYKSSNGKLVASFSSSARHFSMDSDEGKGEPGMLRLVNQQLKRAIQLRDDLYVTVEEAGAMPRVVRLGLDPDPRADD
jgi:hypothetical protein